MKFVNLAKKISLVSMSLLMGSTNLFSADPKLSYNFDENHSVGSSYYGVIDRSYSACSIDNGIYYSSPTDKIDTCLGLTATSSDHAFNSRGNRRSQVAVNVQENNSCLHFGGTFVNGMWIQNAKMTMSCWVKFDYIDNQPITDYSNVRQTRTIASAFSTRVLYSVGLTQDGKLCFSYDANGKRTIVAVDNPSLTLEKGVWYHIAVTAYRHAESGSSQQAVEFYVDNNKVGFKTRYSSENTKCYGQDPDFSSWGYERRAHKITIGAQSDNSEQFSGAIDNFRLYGELLTPYDINNIYNEVLPAFKYDKYTSPGLSHANIKASYGFEETGINVIDSKYGSNGSAVGSVSKVRGKFGFAAQFNLSGGGYYSVPSTSSLQIPNNISFNCWLYLNNLPTSTSNIVLAGKYGSSASLMDYVFHMNNTQLGYTHAKSTVPTYPSAGAKINHGLTAKKWTMITVTVLKTTRQVVFYRDGVKLGVGTVFGNAVWGANATTSPMRIGQSSLDGMIDEVRLYDKPLTDSEVAALYSSYNVGAAKICEEPKVEELNVMAKDELSIEPNPFNPQTKIVVPAIMNLENVKVSIFNAAGKMVQSFSNLNNSSITWNASALPAGTFFVKAVDGQHSLTRKITLMK